MKKLCKLFVICVAIICLFGCSTETDPKRILQATTQIALKEHGFDDDTSSLLEDWTFNENKYKDTFRWNAVTNTDKNGRIKAIFEWSGNEEDDLILVYLLVKGNEIVNELNE